MCLCTNVSIFLLFLIPADAKSIKEQYKILSDELKRFNPELLDKDRLIAISKSDLLDEELKSELKSQLDLELTIDYIFISSDFGQLCLLDQWKNGYGRVQFLSYVIDDGR